jgi:hypothetical protein
MLTGRFITSTELMGPALLSLVNDILVEYPSMPSFMECKAELEGFDMLEVITLKSNLNVMIDAMRDLPYGMKFVFDPQELERVQITLATWRYVVDNTLPELNHFNMTEN